MESTAIMEMGNRIKTLRLAKSMTQEQLARALHVSAQAVSKWELGVSLR
jgi:transcriptional regulator with XRE-family HTH domain